MGCWVAWVVGRYVMGGFWMGWAFWIVGVVLWMGWMGWKAEA